jgi:hypothetical protein
MYLFQKHPITYTPVTVIELEEWRKPDLLVAAFLGQPGISLLIKAVYGQYLGLVGDEPEELEMRNEPKPEPSVQALIPSRDCEGAVLSKRNEPAGPGPNAKDDGASATSPPPCPRCSCSCNNNDDKEHDADEIDDEEDDNTSATTTNTNSAHSQPRPTFQSVVFFTLQSFPEALRAVYRNLEYNFGPLR